MEWDLLYSPVFTRYRRYISPIKSTNDVDDVTIVATIQYIELTRIATICNTSTYMKQPTKRRARDVHRKTTVEKLPASRSNLLTECFDLPADLYLATEDLRSSSILPDLDCKLETITLRWACCLLALRALRTRTAFGWINRGWSGISKNRGWMAGEPAGWAC